MAVVVGGMAPNGTGHLGGETRREAEHKGWRDAERERERESHRPCERTREGRTSVSRESCFYLDL